MSFEPVRLSEIRSLLAGETGPAASIAGNPYAAGSIAANPYGMGAVTGAAGGYGPAGSTLTSKDGSIYGLKKDDFLKLFLAQLENQDPTKPVDDKEFLGQLAQLTMIDTLQQVEKSLSGSQLASAAGLIGKQVTGLDVDGAAVTGVVDGVVQATDAGLVLKVGTQFVKPENVTTVGEPPASTTA